MAKISIDYGKSIDTVNLGDIEVGQAFFPENEANNLMIKLNEMEGGNLQNMVSVTSLTENRILFLPPNTQVIPREVDISVRVRGRYTKD